MRILGLDLGSTSVKAIELDSSFGRFEVREYHEQKFDAGTPIEQAVRNLLQSLPGTPDRIATTLKTGQTTFRDLQLPTRDKKAIQAGVRFELDDDLPFPIEQVVSDYSILSQSAQGSEVHVAAVSAKQLEASLVSLSDLGIEPTLVTTEVWALRTLLNRIMPGSAQAEPILVAQLGHERSVLYVQWKGAPVIAREISWGGRDLTTSISKKYGITVSQAEQAKHDHGFVLSSHQHEQATPEQEEFSKAIESSLQVLVQELRQVKLACKSIVKHHPTQIAITGGTSLLPGLSKYIEDELSTPTKPLRALSSMAASGVTYSEQTDAKFTLAAAAALCLVGNEKSSGINLRQGVYAPRGQGKGFQLSQFRGALISLAAIGASLLISLIVEGSYYRSQIDLLDEQLKTNLRSFFGQISTSGMKNYLASPSTLKKAVNSELTKQREIAKLFGENPVSPLSYLKELSKWIPSDVVLDMTTYQLGASPEGPFNPASQDRTISLSFIVPTPATAERLAGILGGKISGIQKSAPTEVAGSTSGEKRWKVTFTGKPSEQAYGK